MNRFLAAALAGLAVAEAEQAEGAVPLLSGGALGGARGPNPFPAPPAFNAHGGRHVPEPVTHKLVINQQPQPWQKEAAKAKARREARRNAAARNAALPLVDQQAA